MGEPPDRLAETSPTASGIATVQMVAAYQSRFWPCLYPKDMDQGFEAPKRKDRWFKLTRENRNHEKPWG